MLKEIIDFKLLDVGKDALSNAKHFHENCYEILYVYSGTGSVLVRDRILTLQEGAIYFINGMDTHCTIPSEPEKYQRSKLIVSADFIDNLANSTGCTDMVQYLFNKSGVSVVMPDENNAKKLSKHFKSIEIALLQDSIYAKPVVSSEIVKILCIGHSNESVSLHYSDERIIKILEYINSNLGNKITLDDICRKVHISKYHLCHIFKELVGMPISEYVLSRRLSMAKQLLIRTDTPLSEISELLGFSSFSYFSKAFKESENMSPSTYRKIQK